MVAVESSPAKPDNVVREEPVVPLTEASVATPAVEGIPESTWYPPSNKRGLDAAVASIAAEPSCMKPRGMVEGTAATPSPSPIEPKLVIGPSSAATSPLVEPSAATPSPVPSPNLQLGGLVWQE